MYWAPPFVILPPRTFLQPPGLHLSRHTLPHDPPPFDGGGPTRDASLSASAECTHPVVLVASIHCLLGYTLTFLSAQSMFNGQDINGRCRT